MWWNAWTENDHRIIGLHKLMFNWKIECWDWGGNLPTIHQILFKQWKNWSDRRCKRNKGWIRVRSLNNHLLRCTSNARGRNFAHHLTNFFINGKIEKWKKRRRRETEGVAKGDEIFFRHQRQNSRKKMKIATCDPSELRMTLLVLKREVFH